MKDIKLNETMFQQVVESVLIELEMVSESMSKLVRERVGKYNIIEEGLIKTEDATKTIQFVERNVELKKNSIHVTREINDENNFVSYIKFLFINRTINYEIINEINRIMGVCGWFLSSFIYNGSTMSGNIDDFSMVYKGGTYAITFDAKFDTEIPTNLLPNKLYHSTAYSCVNNILNYGLIPKSKSLISNYPSRVYFAYDVEDCIEYGKTKLNSIKANRNSQFMTDDMLSIIELDVSKLKRNYCFMSDVNSNFKAVYCLEPIPSYALSLYKNINLK